MFVNAGCCVTGPFDPNKEKSTEKGNCISVERNVSTDDLEKMAKDFKNKQASEQVNRSFLKWAGGKGALIPELRQLMPKGKRLIEPFVGAGNVFINLEYESYLLADSNADLINVYIALKHRLDEVLFNVEALFTEESDYYAVRDNFNQYKSNFSIDMLSAMFIYLNRHGFNGLCRYNKKGNFNVPKGKHKTIYRPVSEMRQFAEKLNQKNVRLLAKDFTKTIKQAGYGDVIYCDPPYLPFENTTSFTGYTPSSFDQETTKQLALILFAAVKNGASAVVSNHDTPQVREILNSCGFKIHEVTAPGRIAANGNRASRQEIIAVLTPDMLKEKV